MVTFEDWVSARGGTATGPVRAGADALPGRSLGGPFVHPEPLYRLYKNQSAATKYENDAYEMAKLAQRLSTPPSPGIGMGTPALQTYEDGSLGYPGTASANPGVYPNGSGDPLLVLLQMWLNNRFPSGR